MNVSHGFMLAMKTTNKIPIMTGIESVGCIQPTLQSNNANTYVVWAWIHPTSFMLAMETRNKSSIMIDIEPWDSPAQPSEQQYKHTCCLGMDVSHDFMLAMKPQI